MKYMGSKNRIAKYLLPIILADRKDGQWYVEPFVGGANMIDKVEGNRIGSDVNSYLIAALVMVRDEPRLIPRNNLEYTEQMYLAAKKSDLSNPVDCFAMFNYSFGGKFRDSWARNKRGTDYVKECVKNILIQSDKINGVEFESCNYLELEIPAESIIYCDPPYANTTKYKDDFNHDVFWQWCRDMSDKGHQVFISEYNAPDDFECLWQKEIQSGLNTNSTKKGIEKLFKYNP